MEPLLVYKRYEIPVTASGLLETKKFELDKNIRRVLGLQVSSDRPDLLFYRGSQQITIGGDELFPEGFESRLLMSGIQVPPAGRFYPLGDAFTPRTSEVRVQFRDIPSAYAAFANYNFILVLQCAIHP